MQRLLAIFLLLAASPALSSEYPRLLLPRGQVNARIMQLVPSPRAMELGTKLKEAISRNPDWWREHVQRAETGKALPYDSRLGLTEAEYKEFLESANQQTLQEVGREILLFDWSTPEKVVLKAGGALSDLNGIELNLARDQVTTEFGTLSDVSEVNNALPNSPTGPWRGIQWRLESGSPDSSAVAASFALGRLASGRECILYFRAKQIDNGLLTRRADLLVFYPLP